MPGFDQRPPVGGVPVGNFSLATEINRTSQGGLRFRLGYNPPIFGPWLMELGLLEIESAQGDPLFTSEALESREYPLWDIAQDARSLGARCPLSVAQSDWCAWPVLLLRGSFDVGKDITLTLADDLPPEVTLCLALREQRRILTPGESVRFYLGPGELRLALAVDHPHAWTRLQFDDAEALAGYALEIFSDLYGASAGVCRRLPCTGDETLDRYARWYLSAAVTLTRTALPHASYSLQYEQKEHDERIDLDLARMGLDRLAITLGYCEHNPRDGYWTSFPHLLLWPEIERRMLLAYFAAQARDGSFQVCFPIIFRHNSIDTTAYVLHRVYRYAAAHDDWETARACHAGDAMARAVNYLLARCEANGLPEHYDFWADWKDVRQVDDRRYAPHSAFVTLAALKATALVAARMGDNALHDRCQAAYARGWERVHRHVDDDGLWDGQGYVTRWRDGRVDAHVQLDQLVGLLFGVVPRARWQTVLDTVRTTCHGPIGPRETYPYREGEDWEQGDYHNGGVWPLMAGIDALARALRGEGAGEPEVAREILRTVGYHDLERFGDWGPHERLHGETGENRGFWLQGWSSMMAAATWALAKPELPIWRGLAVEEDG